jgi:hypothetical protein
MKTGKISRISKDDLARSGEALPKWIESFLNPLNDFIEKCGSALQSNLTFDDNFLCKRITQDLTHNVALELNPYPSQRKNLRVTGVIPVSGGGLAIDKFKWVQKENGNISVSVSFDGGTSSTKARCSLIVLLG